MSPHRVSWILAALLFTTAGARADDACAPDPDVLSAHGFASERQVLDAAARPGPNQLDAIDVLGHVCDPGGVAVVATLILDRKPEVADRAIEDSGTWKDPRIVRALVARMTDRHSPAVVRIDAYDELVERKHPLAPKYAVEVEAAVDRFFAQQAAGPNHP